MNCGFSLSHYKEVLELATSKGYLFLTMEDWVRQKDALKDSKVIVLRHDIDHDLKLTLKFARIEMTLGIKSTYFIRIHAKNYSPFSLENYRILKELISMGHEVALHHDCDFASLVDEDSKEFLKRDKEIFEKLLGREVTGISSHEPNKSEFVITDSDISEFGFMYQAYSPKFIDEMKYISDSSSRWREGCMHEWIEKGEEKLCILTHPIWWSEKSPLENY